MRLIETVQQLLGQHGIPFVPDGPDTLLLGFPHLDGVFYGDLQVHEERRIILIQMAPPLKAPQEKRLRIAELMTRANRHILQGNLEVSLATGLMTCRTSIVLGYSDCQPDLLYHMLASNWWEITRWFPAIKAVIAGVLSPEQATNMILDEDQIDERDDVDDTDPFGGRLSDTQYGSMN